MGTGYLILLWSSCCLLFLSHPSAAWQPHSTIPSHWYMLRRYEPDADLVHFEFREKPTNIFTLLDYLAPIPLKSKALAKVGFRSQPSSSKKMDTLIQSLFADNRTEIPVTVFVYMWVNPLWRGQQIGHSLLSLAIEESLKRGVSYMIIVHDDQGSGKLIQYYESKGFIPIYELLDKAMLKKLD